MRTHFDTTTLKDFIDYVFNGNLWRSRIPNTTVQYENPNSETILLIDESTGEQREVDLADYLNIQFYKWKNHIVSVDASDFYQPTNTDQRLSVLEEWVRSLNFSMNRAFALVEKIDSEVVTSQDIDSATITGRITFLIQTNKVDNLDYYVNKLRNAYLGVPQDMQNSYGDKIKAFFLLGDLIYEEEPFVTQVGQVIVATSNFRLTYLADAQTYSDIEIAISLTGDDTYDSNGNVVGDSKYMTMPITKVTWQNIYSHSALTMQRRPDLSGCVAIALSTAKTLAFFDFNKELTEAFNAKFWSAPAIRVDGKLTTVGDVNVPVWIRVTTKEHTYVYHDVIQQMEKVLTNNDFNVSSITLAGYGKQPTM